MTDPDPHLDLDPDPQPLLDSESGAAVSIAALSKVYQSGESAQGGRVVSVVAADTLDLDLLPATVTAVTGPSGSGKSTLLRLIGGRSRPDGGVVAVDGATVRPPSRRALAGYRSRIGFVTETAELLPALNVLGNVLLPAQPTQAGGGPPRLGTMARWKASQRRRAELSSQAYALLALVDLAGLEKTLPGRLTPAEQQRVALARALINRPSLLLLDEPTGRLDTRSGEVVMDLVLRLREERGLTVLLATHDPEVAIRCDRVVRLRDGSIIDDSDAVG